MVTPAAASPQATATAPRQRDLLDRTIARHLLDPGTLPGADEPVLIDLINTINATLHWSEPERARAVRARVGLHHARVARLLAEAQAVVAGNEARRRAA